MTTDTREGRAAPLASPVRNRYFYGKLLDVHHMELEQRYFVDRRRLLNRLTLGSGVLCGLGVRPTPGGQVLIEPGVALDQAGREIVVDATVAIADPWTLTDSEGRPTQERVEGGPVLLCLAYHECPIEPTPVLVADCEVREECVAGAIRERFMVLVMRGLPTTRGLTEEQCRSIFGGHGEPGGSTGGGVAPGTSRSGPPVRAVGGGGPATEDLRTRICEALRGPCDPAPAGCVPLALVYRDADGVAAEDCAVRTTIYSNAVLLDLLLCLAERVEECCGQTPPTSDLPVVTALSPAPRASVGLDELDPLLGESAAITIQFDRAMEVSHLEAPDEWLRLWRIRPTNLGSTPSWDLSRSRIEYRPTDGQTAIYLIGTELEPGDLGLIQIRAAEGPAVGGLISDTSTPPQLLDAELAGTGLTDVELEGIWQKYDVPEDSNVVHKDFLNKLLGNPPPGSKKELPSGNRTQAGVLASWFRIIG